MPAELQQRKVVKVFDEAHSEAWSTRREETVKRGIMLYSIDSHLNGEALASIQDLERELATPLLAFSRHSIEPASMTEQQLARIRALESSLGVSLVAVAA